MKEEKVLGLSTATPLSNLCTDSAITNDFNFKKIRNVENKFSHINSKLDTMLLFYAIIVGYIGSHIKCNINIYICFVNYD